VELVKKTPPPHSEVRGNASEEFSKQPRERDHPENKAASRDREQAKKWREVSLLIFYFTFVK
jgi:hypothetical protein